MIGQKVTVETKVEGGTTAYIPKDSQGNALSESQYQPPAHVIDLFALCMKDYQIGYGLQHRPFDYFDGISLLERTRLDQRTFAAFVGAEWVPQSKKWRWRGRKNTARNKLIAIAAHMLAGILFPTVFAQDDQQKEQKMAARVMRIQVEHHLRKAKYDLQFLFSILSALVCPAVFLQVEWIEAMQNVKVRMEDGSITTQKAIDELLSGLNLNIRPVDEIILGDFFTFDLQKQPHIIDVQRISWDQARKIYSGKYFNKEGKDLFDFVSAGKTRCVIAAQEKQVLYDIEWTEADGDFVQVLTFKYRPEDLEAVWVGGVFMGDEGDNKDELYAANAFKHRRMVLAFTDAGDMTWASAPIYNIAKSGFEPADPYGRFAYFKSGAFKEYWDDDSINHAYRLLQDGMTLDVMKPIIASGVAKIDGTIMAPGSVSTIPDAAGKVTAYSIGPNLGAAMQVLQQNNADMSESTVDKILQGQLGVRQTMFAVNAAMTNAKIMLGLFGLLVADLVIQVGDLTVDCIIEHATMGMLDTAVPGALGMKYKTFLAQSKEHGRDITHRIVYTDRYFDKKLNAQQIRKREWELYESDGGKDANTFTWEVNPWAVARMRYQTFMDADQIIARSIGGDKQQKQMAFEMLTDPRVLPFIDPEAVANDFIIEEFGGNDPDRYKKKGGQQGQDGNAMLQAIMGGMKGGDNDAATDAATSSQPVSPQTRSAAPATQGGSVGGAGSAMAMAVPHAGMM